jgi:alkylation response protein AidB-like acyl-CoA dehydrogenase
MADDAQALRSNEDLRAEIAAWLAAHWSAEQKRDRAGWFAKVVEARWAVPSWPVEWHGRGLSEDQAQIIAKAFNRAGAPAGGQDRTNLWANTLLKYGSEALKAKLIGPLLRDEVGMCLLYSEPGAGSDLAGVRTKAERQGDAYIINGQKVWTSQAAKADYGMLIARTDLDVPKHKGISFFFCPMKQPGVEVRPLRQITDESHFNEVFLTDVVVPVENRLGEPGDGWGVLQTALAYERLIMGEYARAARGDGKKGQNQEPLIAMARETKGEEPLIALARERGRLADPVIRQEIARAIAYKTLNGLNTARAKAERSPGAASPLMSLGKLAMSRILHEDARVRTLILGAEGLLEGPEHPRAEDANFLSLNAFFTSIGGGTDQIQRNIIGERVLGLPKEPEVDRDIPFRQVRGG